MLAQIDRRKTMNQKSGEAIVAEQKIAEKFRHSRAVTTPNRVLPMKRRTRDQNQIGTQ